MPFAKYMLKMSIHFLSSPVCLCTACSSVISVQQLNDFSSISVVVYTVNVTGPWAFTAREPWYGEYGRRFTSASTWWWWRQPGDCWLQVHQVRCDSLSRQRHTNVHPKSSQTATAATQEWRRPSGITQLWILTLLCSIFNTDFLAHVIIK